MVLDKLKKAKGGGMKELAKCPNCGKHNKITAKFCESCGTKLDSATKTSNTNEKTKNTSEGLKNWWNKLSTKEKTISGVVACCIGVFLLIMVAGALAPEPTHLSVNTVNAQIDDKVTEYVINGTVEPNAKVNITSSSLNLTNVEVKVDNQTGNFQYKLKIPVNVTDLSVTVNASAPGKLETSQIVNIQRPLTPLTVNPTPTLKDANKTVAIEGTTDPQAKIKIISSDLNIKEITIKADSKGHFKYVINVPSNISSGSVLIIAESAGKRVNTYSETIVREATPPPTTTNSNTANTGSASDSGSSGSYSSTTGSSSSSSGSYGSYIGNARSHIFHYASCYHVDAMNEENKVSFSTRQEAISAGYRPCKDCSP